MIIVAYSRANNPCRFAVSIRRGGSVVSLHLLDLPSSKLRSRFPSADQKEERATCRNPIPGCLGPGPRDRRRRYECCGNPAW